MTTVETTPVPMPPETSSMLRELQSEILMRTAFLSLVPAFVLLVAAGDIAQPARLGLPALILVVVPVAVWGLRANHLAAAWAAVLGFVLADLLLIVWAHAGVALCLLALPAGLAALFTGPYGGTAFAVAASLFTLLSSQAILPADGALRLTALTLICSPVAVVWLGKQPVITSWEWSWSSYVQNRRLLEEARDTQVQLKQALADLADANLQLTRLNRLAQALRRTAEEARRAKEQFVANVSHELRTPLNMIIGFSEMIVGAPETYGERLPPALLSDLAVILRNSQHLSSLIDDVLDLSQIEAGHMALSKERISLAEIIEAAAIAVRPLFASKGLFLETEAADDLVAYCDRTRMREVLLNLLSNAGRFTEQGGVRVRAWRDEGDVVVSVTDTGPGISTQDKERIFQPFQQLDGSVRRRYGGTGLGLTISKSFVEQHGGSMWLESTVGAGTTFFFRLPAEPSPAGDPAVSRWFSPYLDYDEHPHHAAPQRFSVRPRFVIVEGGDSLARLMGRYLEGAELAPLPSLNAAWRELARLPAVALLVNDMATGEALHRIQEAEALPYGTPAIVCSLPGAAEEAGLLGVAGYLVKPVSRGPLLAALSRLNLQGQTVLIVDDEPEALRLFRRMLASQDESYRVLRASNGREALRILAEEHPDAMLLDLAMPEMDGFQLLAAKSADPAIRDIPVVVISARDPAGQPIVTNSLAVTRGGGISMPQLLACIDALSRILSATDQAGDPVQPEMTPG